MRNVALGFFLTLVLLLDACVIATPTYDELYAEAEATGDFSKVDRFEKDVEKAEAFYRNKRRCQRHTEYLWFCSNPAGSTRRYMKEDEFESMEAMVKRYRHERHECGCARKRDLFQ